MPVINPAYNAVMLAEAMCKHEGFTYAPSETVYWQQGYSSERDFIYTTTQTFSREQLVQLNDEVGDKRSLLICCKAFTGRTDEMNNLTVKKIPKAILSKCDFGKDDYSLQVANLPMAESAAEPIGNGASQNPRVPPSQERQADASFRQDSIHGVMSDSGCMIVPQ